MSNDKNQFERLLRLQTSVNRLVLENKRAIEPLLDHLQSVLEMPDLTRIPKNTFLVYETTQAWVPDSERFVVAEEFLPGVEYGFTSTRFQTTQSFKDFFGEKVEEPIKDVCLTVWELLQPADGDAITNSLEGWEVTRTGLHEMKLFLMHMAREHKYVFPTKYTKNGESDHCFVAAEWKNETWELYFVGRSVPLNAGYRVVCVRKPA